MIRLLSVEVLIHDAGSSSSGTGVWPAPTCPFDWRRFFEDFAAVLCLHCPDLSVCPERYVLEISLTVFAGDEPVMHTAKHKSDHMSTRDPARLTFTVGPALRFKMGGAANGN